jgi:NADH:ubiquinone oxidoreductase subunit E
MLQDLQAEYGYLPADKLKQLSIQLELPLSRIYSVATFYASFHLAPKGQHEVTLCMGTVCYLKGADKISETICREFKVEPGGTTPDRLFSYQPVNCVGACALAPVMIVDGEYHDGVTPESAMVILNELSAEAVGEDIHATPKPKTQAKGKTRKKAEVKSAAKAKTEAQPAAVKTSTKKTAARKPTKTRPQAVKDTVKKPVSKKTKASVEKAAAKKTATKPKTRTRASTAGKSSSQKVAQKAASQTKISKSKTSPKKVTKKVQPGGRTAQKEGSS